MSSRPAGAAEFVPPAIRVTWRGGKGNVVKRSVVLWVIAVVVTLSSAVWQRMTGPTYPMRVRAAADGVAVAGKLLRTQTVGVPLPVSLEAGEGMTGEIRWRRWPSDDPWQTVAMTREGDRLEGAVPPQTAKAAKVEYEVRLTGPRGGEVRYPTKVRFKGAVPGPVLGVHIFAMFFGMMFSLRAGLEALARGPGLGRQTVVTLVCLGAGGLMLGPIVQRYAFDAYWTGWPVGEDLTDNKLAAAVLAWVIAAWQQRRGRRWPSAVAALVTFVIFVIPHSLHGSTHDYETGAHIQAAVRRLWPLA